MVPHMQAGGASYRIDRRYVGVGRIARSSGTDNLTTHKRILAMLSGLHASGRLDLLKDIRDGAREPLAVLYHYERGQLDRLPSKETAGDLETALRAFLANHDAGKSYKANLKTAIGHIVKIAGKSVSIADLPTVVRAAKEKMRTTPIAFNRLRSQMMSFAAEVQGEMSPLWVEIKRVKRFKKAEGNRPHALLRRPLTVAELDKVCAAYVDHIVYKGRRGGGKVVARVICGGDLWHMTRFLATTGMRPAEYWQRNGASWTPELDCIQVNGTKTAAASRPTLLIDAYWPPYCGEQFFRKAFGDASKKALGVGLDLYSLRRTFAAFCESARIEPSRARAYLGHGPKTVTDIYLQTSVRPFVAADSKIVAKWMESQRSSIVSSITLVREG